jgi:putative membrane protein
MVGLHTTLVVIHVVGNLVWIGAILATGLVLAANSAPGVDRGRLARQIYVTLAVPGFLASFIAGVVRLALTHEYYFVQTKFMHGKLLLALIVIALHHIIGARAKRVATGKSVSAGPVTVFAVGLLLSAAGAAFLAIARPF